MIWLAGGFHLAVKVIMKLRSRTLLARSMQYHIITDELTAQLGLSEHLLSDIADSIGRKSLVVSKLAMKVHLYRSLCLFQGIQPDRLN
jgi:hypothetical protein